MHVTRNKAAPREGFWIAIYLMKICSGKQKFCAAWPHVACLDSVNRGFGSPCVTLCIPKTFGIKLGLDSLLSKQKSERCCARMCYDKFLDTDKGQSGEHTCAGGLVMLIKDKNKNGG